MPDGDASYYVNVRMRPPDRYEDYLVQDLISDVEAKFPVNSGRSHRAIIGISMGGFGAVNLSLKHPDLFIFAAGMSSAIDVPTRPSSFKRMAQYREHEAIFGQWGTVTRRRNDPFLRVQSVKPSRAP